ncbi:Endonuclease/exonuclease/phosphatase, partial [Mycena amicta]
EIIPGRAILLETKWHGEEKLTILGIYAPNSKADNEEFWKKLQRYFEQNPNVPRPEIIAGDFNVVEDKVDRMPMHEDGEGQVNALQELKRYLGLVDGWRDTHPTTKAYTFYQKATGSRSRLDRILVTPRLLQLCREWEIKTHGIPSDHVNIASVMIASSKAPLIGRGRWSISKETRNNRELTKMMHDTGVEAIKRIEECTERTPTRNAQTIYKKWKTEVAELARKIEKKSVPKAEKAKRELETQLEEINNDDDMPEDEKKVK